MAIKEFLYYCIESEFVQEQIENNTKTVGVPKLALKRIETLQIPLPTIEEQQKIVAQIEVLEAEITKAQQVIDNAPLQKAAILKKYL